MLITRKLSVDVMHSIAGALEKKLGDGYVVDAGVMQIADISDGNVSTHQGLRILSKVSDDAGKVVFLEGYEDAENIDSLTERIARDFLAGKELEYLFNVAGENDFPDFNSDSLYLSLVNKGSVNPINVSYPFAEGLCLQLEIRLGPDEEGDFISFPIPKTVLEVIEMSEEDAYFVALGNTVRENPPVFYKFNTLTFTQLEGDNLRALIPDAQNPLSPGFKLSGRKFGDVFCVTCNRICNGATGIAYPGVLSDINIALKEGFHVIPASREMVLIIPDSYDATKELIKEWLSGGNREMIRNGDDKFWLSDDIYHFSLDEGGIKKVI